MRDVTGQGCRGASRGVTLASMRPTAYALLATGLWHAMACNPVDPEVNRVDGAMYTTPGGGDAGIVDGGPRDGGDAGRRDGGDAAP